MPASPSQTCLPWLDDFPLRSPPPTDCPATKTQGSNLGEHRREGSRLAATPSSLSLGAIDSSRQTIWEAQGEGRWVRRGQWCSGVI